MLLDRCEIIESDVDPTRQQIGHRQCRALVRNFEHIDAGGCFQPFEGNATDRSIAVRDIGELAGVRLGVRDQFGQRLGRYAGVHHQEERRPRETADRRQVAGRIVAQRRFERRRDDEVALSAEQQRVSIGRRLGNQVCGDRSGSATFVFDGDRLLP